MKYFLLAFVMFTVLMPWSLDAQTYVFTEDFEGASPQVTSSSSGTNGWGISTTLFNSGLKSDSCTVATADTTILTTDAFSTVGSSIVTLEFDHICKIEYTDAAIVEVSADNGATWTQLTNPLYQGQGQFGNLGNKFSSTSYVSWFPAVNDSMPNNTWWKHEKFNISSLVANSSQVKVRFVLTDGTIPNGANNNVGWFIDDIKVWIPSMQEASAENYYLPYSLESGCGLTNETIQLTIANNGATSINGNLTASFKREGLPAVTETVPGIIIPGDSLLYTFTNKINLYSTQDTNYEIKVWVSLLNDPNQANDTLVDSVISKVPLADPIFTSPTIPFGTSTTLTASHTDSITWSSDPLGANIIQYGSSYTTPNLFDTTTYYVQAGASNGGAFMITEVCHYKTTTGAPSGGWPSYLVGDDYIEITGVPNSDLGGFVLEQWTGTTMANTYTFPQGTVLSPQGTAIIAVGQGAGAQSPSNYYYNGATTTTFSSSTPAGRIIKDPAGNIIDAVGVNGYSFPAAANVSASDWSSSPTGGVSTCGFRLTGVDNNTGSNWVVSSSSNTQNPNTLNSGVILPSASGCPSRVLPVTVSVSGIPIYNAGIESFVTPVGAQTQGAIVPVVVNLKNFSGDTLKKVTINYSVNGVLRTPTLWTGNLPYNQITPVTIGTDTFNGGAYTFRAWTTLPNDSADQYTANDSSLVMAYVCLAGNFTLGTSSSDFPDFASLQTILTNVGVCGPTTINIMPGTYNEQLLLGTIAGLSDTSQLIFQSSTGIASDVTIQYAASSTTNNYVVRFDGSEYISFKNLTIKSTSTTNYSIAVSLAGNAQHNSVINCNIQATGASSSYNNAIRFESGSSPKYNLFKGNTLTGGYYSVYFYGQSSYSNKGNELIDNDISGFNYFGIYTYYQDSVIVRGNYIHNSISPSYAYGGYIYRARNGYRIEDNTVTLARSNYNYGFRIYFCNYQAPSGSAPGIIANNMISLTNGSSTNYGLYSYYSDNVKYYYNSVEVTAGSTTSRAFHQYNNTSTGTGVVVLNNNFSCSVGGYAAYFQAPSAIDTSDYNNFYSTGTNLAYWGSNVANLAALQSASGKDAHSVSANPQFVSNTDLHTGAIALHAAGTPISGITTDIDGDLRAATPCIGADEYILLGNDAGILALSSPTVSCPGDTANIIVELRNFGTDTLFTCNINWELNSVSQNTYSYNDTLLAGQSVDVTLGTYVFNAGISYNMDFWTTSPNGTTDLQTSNDSLVVNNFKTAIPAGTYVVGPSSSADYSNLDSVIADLNAYGICGSVVFNIESGTYSSRIVLNNIIGVSSVNTITIQSLTGDSSDVTINYAATSSLPAVLSLSNMSYVTINALTFNITGGAAKASAYWGNSNHNTISSCVFNLPSGTSSSFYGFYLNSQNIEYNTFINNKVVNGYYGAYSRGSGSTSLGKGNSYINNTFENFYYYGIYSYYQDSITIRGNKFVSSPSSSYPRGVYAYYTDNAEISGNDIQLSGSSYSYGMYLYYMDASSSNPGLITNNMINIQGGTSSSYGFYFGTNTHQRLSNNSIRVNATAASRGIYVISGSYNEAKNNIFDGGIGYAAYFSSTTSFQTVDYNNYYTTGSKFVYYSGDKATLTALQSASGKDAHSMDINPNFISSTDLHILSGAINGSGTPLSYVTTDIDGDMRDSLNPDMGADEFSPAAQDISIISIDMQSSYCAATTEDVVATYINTGSDTIFNNLNAQYSLDAGTTWITENTNTVIAPLDTLVYTFNTQVDLSTTQDTTFYLLVKGDLLNDPITFNDTLTLSIFNGMLPASPTALSGSTTYSNTATLTATSTGIVFWFETDTSSLPISSGNSYTTGSLFDTTVYYCGAIGTNGCISTRVPDTAYVTGIPSGDVGIAEIFVNEGCNVDSAELVTVKIYNQGYGTVSGNLTATYKIDNNSYITPENISTSIGSNDTITYTFNTTANLYAYWADTTFSIEAKVVLANDPYYLNDTLSLSPIEVSYTPAAPIVTSPITIGYGTIPTLTATSQDSIYWFENTTDSTETGVGSSFTWPVALYQTDTFFARAGGGSGAQLIISELDLGGPDAIEVQNVSGADIDATGWKLVISNNYSNINTANSITQDIGYIANGSVKYWTDASSTNYWGNNILWNPGSGTSYGAWAFILDNLGNVVDEVFIGFTASNIANISMTINGFSLTAADFNWTGDGISTYTSNVLNRVSYQLSNSNEWQNTSSGSLGTPNTNMTFNGIVGGGSSLCASNFVPVVINVGPPPAIDAGMDSVVSPTDNEVAGTPVDIDVRIKNYGTNSLTNVDIVYELDSVVIDTFAWTGSLAFNAVSSPITIYTDTFTPGGHTLRAWTQNANGSPTAGVNLNDTITKQFSACLSGVYTLGDSTSDFPTFNDALTALYSAGVCSNVTFNIKPGNYNTQIALQPVVGAGPNSRITFQSATGDSTDVIIQATPAGATTNYVIIFYGGSYYTVKNVTIKALGTYSRAVVYYNNSTNNTVENCIVESTVSSSSSAVGFYDWSSSISSFNTIRNNIIRNGYYGIYINGPSSYAQKSFVVEDNEISNFYYYGIYSYYQDSSIFNYNRITDGSSSAAYPRGIYLYRNRGAVEVIGNQISMHGSSYSYGLYNYYTVGTATSQVLIANNAISVDGGTSSSYGIYNGYSNYLTLAHNSINLTNTTVNSRALYQTGGTNQEFINNIFSGGMGYAYYVNTPGAIVTSDYNDLYTTGTNFAYWSGYRANIAALKTASGKEAHSISEEPFFFANDNLHSGGVSLNGAGYPISSLVPMDMDKEMRSTTTPDIGADEFTPPPNDAGIVSIDAPVTPVNIGAANIHVTLRNFGSDTLATANIAWSVNNSTPTSYPWTGSLVSGATADSLNVGSYNFSAGVNSLKVWSANPNAATDGNNLNDTTTMTLIGCLSPMHGTYTIGGTSADFANISDAVAQLVSCGVDSNVIFNINPGTYNEQIVLGEIPGASDTSNVTFQSSTLDSTDVMINYSATSSDNYVVHLHGADWIRFVNLSFEALNSSAGRTIVLDGGASNNIFYGNIIKAPSSTSSSSAPIYSAGDADSYNTFSHNDILNGYYGIYMSGGSTGARENGSVYEYNNIVGYYYYGVYIRYARNLEFHHNFIKNGNNTNYGYAAYIYYVDQGYEIYNNVIDARPNTSHYGLYMYYCQATATNHGKVYNNFIGINSAGSSTCYGTYLYQNKYNDFTNNSIYVKTSYTYSRAIYVSSGNNNRVLNNNVVMDGAGYVYYVTGSSYVSQSNYNNFYSTGSQFAYWSGAASDLAALQSSSGKDGNSVSVDPGYMSSYDLHATSVNLNANATPLAWVTTDIDGELRDTLTPDIGADEFTPQQWDAAVVGFHSPSNYYAAQGTVTPITITLKNFGMDTITTMPVSYVYGNSTPITETWNGNLAPGDTISHTFNTSITTAAGSNTICAYTSLVADSNLYNDTLCMNYGGISLVVPTYSDNFDTPPSMWVSAGTEWELGIPQGTNITSAYSAPNVWMTKLAGNYTDNETSDLLSPYIDFSNASGATLKFWYNSDLMSNDGVTMYYSNDGGSTWITLGYVGDPLATNWYNNQGGGNQWWGGQSNGWMLATYDLSQFNNSTTPIQFKLHFFSNGSGNADGFAIDNFKVELPPIPYDAGVVSIDAPATGTVVGSMGNTVTVTVKNFGTNALGNIPVHYTINGTGVVNESVIVTGGLQPDSTTSFTFTTTFQGPANNYNLCAFTTQSGDIYTSNDSTCKSLLATTPPIDAEASFVSVSPSWHDTTKMTFNTVVSLQIKNNGSNAISNIPVQFLIGTTPIANETYSGTINPGDSAIHTFTTTYHSPNGNYLMCGKTLLANDADNSNDQTCIALIGINDVGIDQASGDQFSVEQNQPNPAFGEVRINYFVPKAGKVHFELLNVLGQRVQSEEYDVSAGNQMIQLDANKLAEGVYYYTVEFDNQRITHKMVVNQ